MNGKILVIASAGGHLTQAMCATSLFDDIVLVSNKINIKDSRIRFSYMIPDTQFNAIIHFFNIFIALYILIRHRPSLIVSTGGPIVLPFALLSKLLCFNFVFIDTLSRVVELSNTGKLLRKYKLYDVFFAQWETVAKANGVRYIGKCFDILDENSDVKKITPVDPPAIPMVLVTLGTCDYPFDRFIELVSTHPLYKSPNVRWILQVGDNSVSVLPENGEVIGLVSRQEMENYVKQASLVISHCGIGSINLMLSYQKRVIFVPRVEKYGEFSDDHQLQIAEEINHPLMTVVHPGNSLPSFSVEGLIKQPRYDLPRDITNREFSRQIYTACNKAS
ncbi:glycosyltransferase [Litoribrevibacter albus]|uniref:Glycosyl transferase family 28 C-terminal domain-containing protein n=1 Tax=Litoribrevibacter albus TaxID=1473156 RepID=A0AA37W4L6_9GAMM|nr:glycosyltransferase [Litoribrevibacter albus]GLQ30282.1 hypothetical protein GCM10007876_07600 [Litoribrevibacter albus]